jgi:hypothetical protein
VREEDSILVALNGRPLASLTNQRPSSPFEVNPFSAQQPEAV